jgi:hypothetical protein
MASGYDYFEQLWQRRTTIEETQEAAFYEVLAMDDLVRARNAKG